ncbi:condensation protein, partial [Streptomyces sp. SID10244]|nr:condensation protein [Streptomyces sp. SID10244]
MRANTARLGEALPLARIGLTPVYMTFGDLIRTNRSDVFMVSYVDYRRLGLPASVTTRQISSPRRTDTAQFWFWRDADGVHLRARYPETALAHRTMNGVLDAVDHRLRD